MRTLYIVFARLAAAAAFGAVVGSDPVHAAAARPFEVPGPAATPTASVQEPDLEELFWRCDYAATVEVVDSDVRALCTAIAEQLKVERFDGDFERMLNWWQVNKTLHRQKLERDAGSTN